MHKRLTGPGVLIGLVVTLALALSLVTMSGKVAAVASEEYEKLRIFADVVSIVEESYTEEVKVEDLVYGAIRGMLRGLDPHSSFMTAADYKEMQVDTKGSFGGIGIEIGIRDRALTIIAPIEDTPGDKAGLKAKDKIVRIEDKSTMDMTLGDAVKLMRGPKGAKITIWIMRVGFEEPKPFEIIRDVIKIKSVKFRDLEDGFGYVRITQFQERTTKDLEKALVALGSRKGELKGLVLDLRNNPGGLLPQAVDVSDKFINSGLIVSTKGRTQGQNMRFSAEKDGTHSGFPIVVLVNGGSASASEIVAGALQDHKRAVIMGSQTFGKGSVQTIVPLSDGSAVRLTTSKYYTPSGTSIQAKGIEPDIVMGEEVKLHMKEKDLEGHFEGEDKGKEGDKEPARIRIKETIVEGVEGEEGEDVQLQKALNYLKSWYLFKGTMKQFM
ncbi:MAG: S41 family peptidase [Thermodesulfobacteriota bacterium]